MVTHGGGGRVAARPGVFKPSSSLRPKGSLTAYKHTEQAHRVGLVHLGAAPDVYVVAVRSVALVVLLLRRGEGESE